MAALACFCAVGSTPQTQAQAVDVTLSLETNKIEVGQTTTLHVFAQVIPSKRSSSERIFSWYIDLLNSSATVAVVDFSRLQRPASDNDLSLSSSGTSSGPNRIGIHDTFMNRPGAGVNSPVLLLSVPVKGTAAGRNTFSVRAGTGVPALASDFLVAPIGGGDPWLGGNYLSALVQLQVGSVTNVLTPFRIILTPLQPFSSGRWEISYPTEAGWNYFLQTRPNLGSAAIWQTVPNGPFNSGRITLTNASASSFYRVLAQQGQ